MAGKNYKNILKIATLNLCLGFKNKKLDVENLMAENDINVLCLQEVEIESVYDPSVLIQSIVLFPTCNV